MRHSSILLLIAALLLTSCGTSPVADSPTAVLITPTTTIAANVDGIKTYLLGQTSALATATADLQAAADRYYALAESANFDYTALWKNQREQAIAELTAARKVWLIASPAYEKMEGIVAGTPSLAQFDIDLDAGAAAADDPESAVSFDITLPDGRVLAKPGNLFGVTESTLWGTEPAYDSGVAADWDSDGTVEFGEHLPDANVLKGSTTMLARITTDLQSAAQTWTPTPSDAFTALVVMIPTMNEYFGSWKDSRFVAGETSTQRDFVAISRLADMQDILGGLEVVYAQVQPQVATLDPTQAGQIATDMASLKSFVADVYAQEQAGKTFTPEEADLLGAEAQNRATALTGQISQVAGALGVQIAE